MTYLLHISILIGIYSILAISLDLLAGYTGLLSIAHAAYYGIGAYISALVSLRFGGSFLLAAFCAVLLSSCLGALLALASLYLRGSYFVIATFAFQVVVVTVLDNWMTVTRGPLGLANIPRPRIFTILVSSPADFLILVFISFALALLVSYRVVKSPFGRVLRAIREDEIFAIAAAKNVLASKTVVCFLGAGMAAGAGALYAHYVTYIDPSSFTVMESIFIISLVIIGGAGSLWGPIVGAILLVVIPEILRFLGLPSFIAASLRQIIYGGLLVIFIMWRPRGLIGRFSFLRAESF